MGGCVSNRSSTTKRARQVGAAVPPREQCALDHRRSSRPSRRRRCRSWRQEEVRPRRWLRQAENLHLPLACDGERVGAAATRYPGPPAVLHVQPARWTSGPPRSQTPGYPFPLPPREYAALPLEYATTPRPSHSLPKEPPRAVVRTRRCSPPTSPGSSEHAQRSWEDAYLRRCSHLLAARRPRPSGLLRKRRLPCFH